MASIETIDQGDRVVARRTVVNAPSSELFALVADPHRHGELDGSGTVKDTVRGPSRLTPGAKFSVGMKQFGVPYRITSTVTDFRDDADVKVIEWQHPMGHTWRWQFEETEPGRS
ncbi:MAG: dimethyladenosine transferase, partial [Rhodococcus fascians]